MDSAITSDERLRRHSSCSLAMTIDAIHWSDRPHTNWTALSGVLIKAAAHRAHPIDMLLHLSFWRAWSDVNRQCL